MNVSYFRELSNHHLVITAGDNCLINYQKNMLKDNAINGLLCPVERQSDDKKEYDYLITGYQSLQTYVEGEPLSERVLRILVQSLCGLLEEMNRYLIDGDYLCLRPEHIYLEKRGEEIVKAVFCLFPFQKNLFELQIKELFKYMINEIDYQEQRAVTLAYDLFQSVQEGINLSDLKVMTDIEEKEVVKPEVPCVEVIEEREMTEIALPKAKNRSIIKMIKRNRR